MVILGINDDQIELAEVVVAAEVIVSDGDLVGMVEGDEAAAVVLILCDVGGSV